MLFNIFPKYDIRLEYNVPSLNSTKQKKCDIVVIKNNVPYIIFPIKVIMTNFKQNKNNSWENLTGEITHIKWVNPDVNVIPINIFMDKTPYLNCKKQIKYFETVNVNDISAYTALIDKKLCYDVINYIVEVEHTKNIGDFFNEISPIKKFNTKYRTFDSILYGL